MAVDGRADRIDAVLVVIDEQERLVAAVARRESVIAATSRLVRTAALVGVPVLVTRQYAKGLGDTDSALAPALQVAEKAGAGVGVIDKVTFDCFEEEAFAKALRDTGRKQLIIAGMETHVCVVQTALSGLRWGLDTQVVADACCSRDDESHRVALHRLSRAGVVVTAAESVMYELVGAAASDEFRELLAIVKG